MKITEEIIRIFGSWTKLKIRLHVSENKPVYFRENDRIFYLKKQIPPRRVVFVIGQSPFGESLGAIAEAKAINE